MNPTALPSMSGLADSMTSPMGIAKLLASTVLGILGMYYLNVGRKEQDVGQMFKGGILIVLSIVLF